MRMVDECQEKKADAARKAAEETAAGSMEMENAGAGSAEPGSSAGNEVDGKTGENQSVIRDEAPMVETRLTDLIYQYIKDNYMFDISMQEVARTMNYSEAYFCKLFKQFFGKNFTAYLTEYRIETAKKLLQTPTVNIKEIGKAVGYADSNYFAKVFKRVTGESPSEYRGHDQV